MLNGLCDRVQPSFTPSYVTVSQIGHVDREIGVTLCSKWMGIPAQEFVVRDVLKQLDGGRKWAHYVAYLKPRCYFSGFYLGLGGCCI
jgi:hypothetical protein